MLLVHRSVKFLELTAKSVLIVALLGICGLTVTQ